MKKTAKILALALLASVPVLAQNKKQNKMEKRVINPWQWQDQRSYVQAVEVKNVKGTLYCSGQAAVDADGKSSTADMKTQLAQAIQNLEKVISEAGYECKNIVRLNVITTSSAAFFTCFDIFQDWIAKHGIKQATTLMEVKSLFETLKIEFEATVVR
ncbi:RidA family protein [Flavitalea sp. BT771]|uniref:RidA family protein n=1 Tax=Flavitalea sp. BT771 TaxID=3063329 RepID=UPI0026E239F9|nr:RidA family protein [Flavitalea sp. BT771]MDO6432664.1 RidA family protein [Flavitalea sp. BT771]MDV6222060.1 RidA family protein [Flavitalea sp. BT771]